MGLKPNLTRMCQTIFQRYFLFQFFKTVFKQIMVFSKITFTKTLYFFTKLKKTHFSEGNELLFSKLYTHRWTIEWVIISNIITPKIMIQIINMFTYM